MTSKLTIEKVDTRLVDPPTAQPRILAMSTMAPPAFPIERNNLGAAYGIGGAFIETPFDFTLRPALTQADQIASIRLSRAA